MRRRKEMQAVEARARSAGGGDPEEDLLQDVVGEGGGLRRRRHFLRGSRHPARQIEKASFRQFGPFWVGFGGPK